MPGEIGETFLDPSSRFALKPGTNFRLGQALEGCGFWIFYESQVNYHQVSVYQCWVTFKRIFENFFCSVLTLNFYKNAPFELIAPLILFSMWFFNFWFFDLITGLTKKGQDLVLQIRRGDGSSTELNKTDLKEIPLEDKVELVVKEIKTPDSRSKLMPVEGRSFYTFKDSENFNFKSEIGFFLNSFFKINLKNLVGLLLNLYLSFWLFNSFFESFTPKVVFKFLSKDNFLNKFLMPLYAGFLTFSLFIFSIFFFSFKLIRKTSLGLNLREPTFYQKIVSALRSYAQIILEENGSGWFLQEFLKEDLLKEDLLKEGLLQEDFLKEDLAYSSSNY